MAINPWIVVDGLKITVYEPRIIQRGDCWLGGRKFWKQSRRPLYRAKATREQNVDKPHEIEYLVRGDVDPRVKDYEYGIGDKVIAVGTIKALSERFGIPKTTLRNYADKKYVDRIEKGQKKPWLRRIETKKQGDV